jgi:hypothetical protein
MGRCPIFFGIWEYGAKSFSRYDLFFSFLLLFFFFFKVSELLKSLWRVTTYFGQFMKQQTISLRFVPGFFIKSYLNIYIYILNRLYMDYHSLNSTLAHILPYLIISVAWHVGRCGRCLKKLIMRISSHSFLYTNLTISNN